MMYPLVRDLAVDGIPVTVTCGVLKIARQPYYRWLRRPVSDADWVAAHRANALFDAHGDDPEFGYRLLADEAREVGQSMADRTAWSLCSSNGWWSVFGKKRGRGGKRPGSRHGLAGDERKHGPEGDPSARLRSTQKPCAKPSKKVA